MAFLDQEADDGEEKTAEECADEKKGRAAEEKPAEEAAAEEATAEEKDEAPTEEAGEAAPAEEKKWEEKKDEEAKPEEKPKGTHVPQKQVGDIPVDIYDNGDGTYDCHYKADAGKITIGVKLNGQNVAMSPYKLEVEEDADSDNTGVENFRFVVEAKNRRGQVQADGKAKFIVELDGREGNVEDQKNKVKHLGEQVLHLVHPSCCQWRTLSQLLWNRYIP